MFSQSVLNLITVQCDYISWKTWKNNLHGKNTVPRVLPY